MHVRASASAYFARTNLKRFVSLCSKQVRASSASASQSLKTLFVLTSAIANKDLDVSALKTICKYTENTFLQVQIFLQIFLPRFCTNLEQSFAL